MSEDDQILALSPAEEIMQLKAKLKFNKFILLGVLFISLASASILITSTGYFYLQINKLQQTPSSNFQLQLQRIDKDIKDLSYYIETESHLISAYHLRINLLQQACSVASSPEQVALYKSRENDYQKLLNEMITGSKQLSAMIAGSNLWLSPYEQRLNALIKNSEKRAAQWSDL